MRHQTIKVALALKKSNSSPAASDHSKKSIAAMHAIQNRGKQRADTAATGFQSCYLPKRRRI